MTIEILFWVMFVLIVTICVAALVRQYETLKQEIAMWKEAHDLQEEEEYDS